MPENPQKKKKLKSRVATCFERIGEKEDAADDRQRAAQREYRDARTLRNDAIIRGDADAVQEMSLRMEAARLKEKAALALYFDCGAVVNEFVRATFKTIEDEGTLDQLIADFTKLNKDIKKEIKNIKDLKKSIDQAVAVLKLVEGLFKKVFAA